MECVEICTTKWTILWCAKHSKNKYVVTLLFHFYSNPKEKKDFPEILQCLEK